ncbi:hypothetical protein BDZ89DRAFT_1049640 [Hymenopellis radicata]|nr:hypothetical protein BDZ89DRAFT_1049640 [Hymenopellis radicata]
MSLDNNGKVIVWSPFNASEASAFMAKLASAFSAPIDESMNTNYRGQYQHGMNGQLHYEELGVQRELLMGTRNRRRTAVRWRDKYEGLITLDFRITNEFLALRSKPARWYIPDDFDQGLLNIELISALPYAETGEYLGAASLRPRERLRTLHCALRRSHPSNRASLAGQSQTRVLDFDRCPTEHEEECARMS